MALLYRTWQGLGDIAMPRRCCACRQVFSRHTGNYPGSFLCNTCMALAENQPQVRCNRCALPLGPRPQAFGWTHCRHCRPLLALMPNDQLSCVVCCNYEPPFDQWIARLKYGGAHGLAKNLGGWLGQTMLSAGLALPDLLVPVPSGRKKLQQRGYNQAALIARHAGKVLNRPVCTRLLEKVSESGAQAELGRQERLKNQLGAFRCTRPVPTGLCIGLVDDVVTTGATLQSCVAALRKAGAKSIVLMAVCRTPE